LQRAFFRRMQPARAGDLKASALVFAPHQDDETLGCGGTIALKRADGATVGCVFMTDGATSHSTFMDGKELSRLRNDEALAATAVLGIPRQQVHFLDLPDGRLAEYHPIAVGAVASLLRTYSPQQVFVPFRLDVTPDHEATYRIVSEAIASCGRPVQVCEYPVWTWNHWPWVPLSLRPSRDTLLELLACRRIVRLLKEFRRGVFIGEVLNTKRRALAEHKTQMTVMKPGTGWPTLADVSNGAFLNCFFQQYEVFKCSPAGNGCAATR
jgi:LmbE family N-acetylglucosaminyl deacetylase